MKNKLLFCWLGATDIKASQNIDGIGLGPIAQAVQAEQYVEVILLNTWETTVGETYCQWLSQKTPAKILLKQVSLSSPTHFGEIYQNALKIITEKLTQHSGNADLTFHLSPGTPAMAAVWILLAKARFDAELIESSKEHGVKIAEVPFDISADFIPTLFRNPDQTAAQLAAGLPTIDPAFEDIIHRSEVMQRVIIKARLIAFRSVSVLIEGESGTGKELFARAIHNASPRRNNPFVVINCGAIPSELVEAELFGHEKGAFTGAASAKIGHFEAANSGTLFLDEVGELPKVMQVKLLRTLQEGEVKRIGATASKKIDVRIIAATNRNLIEEVSSGGFREDLFYRLAVAVIKLPALREREGDISLIIDRLLDRINSENERNHNAEHKKISASAKNLLLKHPWPGNVRELQNTLTRATIWSLDEELTEQDIREALLPVPSASKGLETILNRPLVDTFSLPNLMKIVAVHYLERSMQQCHGNKTKAAKLLGLPNYQTLTNWIKKYDIE